MTKLLLVLSATLLSCATFHATPGGPGRSLVACYHLRDMGCAASVDACEKALTPYPELTECAISAASCREADHCTSGIGP
jgi:hypothetical protein